MSNNVSVNSSVLGVIVCGLLSSRKSVRIVVKKKIYIYIYITNCRQYCFGLLGLISAVLMSRMEVKL